MKTTTLFAAATTLVAGAALLALPRSAEAVAPPAEGQTWAIDAGHSSIHFDVEHLGVSRAWGRFDAFEGQFTTGESDADMTVTVTVRAESVNTNNDKRDEHLRSPDFFNARQFPELKFVSTDVKQKREGHWDLEGEFSLLGTTKEIEGELTEIGRGPDPWGGQRAGFTATFTIDRTEFGMDTYPEMLGQDVDLRVDLEGVLQE